MPGMECRAWNAGHGMPGMECRALVVSLLTHFVSLLTHFVSLLTHYPGVLNLNLPHP